MRRRLKIGGGVALALLALLTINALAIDGETRSAQVTTSEGQILELPEGEVQVVESGPRSARPIVLVHCFTCSLEWWSAITPHLTREHRVVALDLLGHGGSEKPGSGYSMPEQADLVAATLKRLRVADATVVGHSLGGTVATALAERHPELVGSLVLVGQAPDESYGPGLPFPENLSFVPVVGEAAWQLMPDASVEDGLGAAFAPGYEVPQFAVDGFRRMTYRSYDDSADGEGDYSNAKPLDRRIAEAGLPLLAIFGAEEQIYDPQRGLDAYRRVPGARTELIGGAGHSPNVEKPRLTARLIREFARVAEKGVDSSVSDVTERGQRPPRSSGRRP
jgi:pimeloyl-ACP methyl ester carboxylesterase